MMSNVRNDIIRLWEGDAPGSIGRDSDWPGPHTPTLEVFRPQNMSTSIGAIIVSPGGAYQYLSDGHEGSAACLWLVSIGITAFLLRYRLAPTYHFPVQKYDIKRSLSVVNSLAVRYGYPKDHIGLMGFSAGGHLTSIATGLFDENDKLGLYIAPMKPSFQVLVYPFIDFVETQNICDPVLPPNSNMTIRQYWSTHHHVTASKTPPTLLIHAADDTIVPMSHSRKYLEACKHQNIDTSFIQMRSGGHGFGLKDEWTILCKEWIHKYWG